MKVFETNEKKLVMELVIKWAGNPNSVVVARVVYEDQSSGQISFPLKTQ
jgi:hypothetical protein